MNPNKQLKGTSCFLSPTLRVESGRGLDGLANTMGTPNGNFKYAASVRCQTWDNKQKIPGLGIYPQILELENIALIGAKRVDVELEVRNEAGHIEARSAFIQIKSLNNRKEET